MNELYQKADQLFAYHVGDEIQVNGIDFYVIADSGATQDYVVALKKEPLTVAEVNLYGGVGTENNHVNRYTQSSVGTASNNAGYGGVAYYSSETCGYVNGVEVSNGCKFSYDDSEIKYIVDSWLNDEFSDDILKEINNYKARLIKKEEYDAISSEYSWKRGDRFGYFTMTAEPSPYPRYYYISLYNGIAYSYVSDFRLSDIRPVINVKKSAIQKTN